jgi:AcrR family transcriptional regulator
MYKKISKRSANKIKNNDLIIAVAEKLFLQNDFENTTMDDVSKEAGLTKRTIYKYFNSKEDLFFAVALRGVEQINSKCEEALMNGKNALEKIRLTNRAIYQFYIESPGMLRLMNYQPQNKLNYEASPSYREMRRRKDEIIQQYMEIIGEGKIDGSINTKLDTKMAVYFAFCASFGLLKMILTMEKSFFWLRDGLDENEFLLFSMDLLADALK